MRVLSSSLVVLSLLATMGVGCAENQDSLSYRRNVPMQGEGVSDATQENTTLKVRGTLSNEGNGSIAQGLGGKDLIAAGKTVEVSALGENGQLTPVAKADIKPGGVFDVDVAKESSPTGLFIMSIKDLAGSIVGSAVLNGIPAFATGFFILIPIDTLTSFKTEVLMTMAKGGTPGIQSYLNVINTFVDGELAGVIVTGGAFIQDITTIFGATSDAIIAATKVIESSLQTLGIPIDLSALTNAQAAAVSGINGLINDTNGKLVSGAKNLLASLKAATSSAVAPVDEALFNTIVNSGAVFGSKMKGSAPTEVAFAASKSPLKAQTELSSDSIQEDFAAMGMDPKIVDTVTKALTTLKAQVAGAKSFGDIDAAKGQFKNVLLGGGSGSSAPTSILALLSTVVGGSIQAVLTQVENLVAPLTQSLTAALSAAPLDSLKLGEALAKFDQEAQTAPAMMNVVSEGNANVVAKALKRIEKTMAH